VAGQPGARVARCRGTGYLALGSADNKAVVSNNQKELPVQQLMDNLNEVTREFGMNINVTKTRWCA